MEGSILEKKRKEALEFSERKFMRNEDSGMTSRSYHVA